MTSISVGNRRRRPRVRSGHTRRVVPAPAARAVARTVAVGAAARTRTGPLLGLVQPAGWAVLLVSLVSLVVGRRLGWDELSVIAAGGIVVLVLCALFLVGRTSVEVSLHLTPERLTVGDPPVSGDVTTTNVSGRPMLPIELDLGVGLRAHRFRLPVLGIRAEHTETFTVPALRRSVIPVGPARTRRGDPLGLFSRTLEWTGVTEVFVRPRALPLESLGSGLLRDLEGVATNDLSSSDLAFHALREYVPGDDLRHVHWLSSAKGNGMMVRQYLDTRRSHVTVIVDQESSSYAGEEDFETAMSIAATIARRSFLDEFDVSFVCGDQTVIAGRAAGVLDAMCRVELGSRALISATLEASRQATDTSLLFIISGSAVGYRDVQRACLAFGPEVRRFAVRVDPAEAARVAEAGGLPVLTVPTLESLPAMLRWSAR